MRGLSVVLPAFFLAACVDLPEGGNASPQDQGSTITSGVFAGLDPGASRLDGLHFAVRAYGPDTARRISDSAEASYNRIMIDTNLFSFQPHGLYQLVVYATGEEYRKKTGQPNWSGGVSVGNAIYSFSGPQLERTVAHEMTHLIWFEFMGRLNLDHRWVNEGLAVYEENKTAGGAGGGDIFSAARPGVRAQPIPMDTMIHLVPATEREYTVSAWYAESESMVRFMIERGGKIGFSQFLAALRDGKNFDQAFASAFPGAWTDLNAFYQSWLRSQQ